MPRIKDQAVKERNCVRIYGCPLAAAIQANGGKALRDADSPAARYASQRQSAKARAISWQLTFPEWMRIWTESGKWPMRGVGIGRFCMARRGDVGPYSSVNVEIQLCTINSRDGLATRFARCEAVMV